MAEDKATMGGNKTRRKSMRMSRIVCKAVVVVIILEGFSCKPGAAIMVEGAGRQDQQSIFGRGRRGNLDGSSGDSLISTFGSGVGGEVSRRMRDRCGRYSLLRVLQQWESLQRRCRLNIRNAGSRDRERDRYEYNNADHDFSPAFPVFDDDGITVGKRARLSYFAPIRGSDRKGNQQQRNYYYEVNGDGLESCCPVVFEVIAPIYGRNRSGHMVQLYKDENVQQKFNEYRCHKDYLEQSCRYMDNQHRRISKCVQQYLDTYALVRSDTSITGWSMEHIRVGSGCACKVDPIKVAAQAGRRRKKVMSSQRTHDFLSSFGNSNNNDSMSRNKNKRRMYQQFSSDY